MAVAETAAAARSLNRPDAISFCALAPSLLRLWQEWQRTPLINAAYYGHPEVVTLLIEAKARIEHKDNNGWTALTYAAGRGREDCVRVLLDAGADKESKSKDTGRTAYSFAKEQRDFPGRDTQVELHKRYTTICELLVTESDKKAEAALAEYDPAD